MTDGSGTSFYDHRGDNVFTTAPATDVGLFVGNTGHRYGYAFPLVGGSVGVLGAQVTHREIRRFFGFGNETARDDESVDFRADRSRVYVEAVVGLRPAPAVSIDFGPAFWFSSPTKEVATFVEVETPYGQDDFAQVGLVGRASCDMRDNPVALGVRRWPVGILPEARLYAQCCLGSQRRRQ